MMSFFDASTVADLEPTACVLAEVQSRAVRCGIDTMVVGAAARDILIQHVVGSAPQRATADIDIAVAVSSWEDIKCLTALAAAVRVKLPGDLTVAVATLPAQSLLKLFAWRDRRHQDTRDAIDLRTILYAYNEGSYFDELYADYEPLLLKRDFHPALAGAERLGREANSIIAAANRSVVTDLLSSDELFDALAAHMGGWRVAENRALLSAYRDGFL